MGGVGFICYRCEGTDLPGAWQRTHFIVSGISILVVVGAGERAYFSILLGERSSLEQAVVGRTSAQIRICVHCFHGHMWSTSWQL